MEASLAMTAISGGKDVSTHHNGELIQSEILKLLAYSGSIHATSRSIVYSLIVASAAYCQISGVKHPKP